MKKLLENWKAPTPAFFKKVINISMVAAAGAAALLMADTLGKAIIPDFSYKLLPWVVVVCKNVLVAGLVAAAISKFQKDNKI